MKQIIHLCITLMNDAARNLGTEMLSDTQYLLTQNLLTQNPQTNGMRVGGGSSEM